MTGCHEDVVLIKSPKFKWEIRVDGKFAAEATDENKDAFLLRYQTLFKRKTVEAVPLKKKPKKVVASGEMAEAEVVGDIDDR